jgi:hypothetical protein
MKFPDDYRTFRNDYLGEPAELRLLRRRSEDRDVL